MQRIANDFAALFAQRNGIDRSVIYRALTHHYQAAFLRATRDERQVLRPLVNWRLYRTDSRTRLRHRLNFFLLCFFQFNINA